MCVIISDRKKHKANSTTSGSSSATVSTALIESIIERLKMDRVRDSTKRNYYSVWKTFNRFIITLDRKPDNWEDRLVLFVGFMIHNKKAQSQTIRSYISAIKSVLKDEGIDINEDRYLLNSLIKACKYRNDEVRKRIPIQKTLLTQLLKFTKQYFLDKLNQPYLATLYMTMFTTCYYGLLRISEVTEGPHAIEAADVYIGTNKNKILLILRSSKMHGRYTHPQQMKISSIPRNETEANKQDKQYCPFRAIERIFQYQTWIQKR